MGGRREGREDGREGREDGRERREDGRERREDGRERGMDGGREGGGRMGWRERGMDGRRGEGEWKGERDGHRELLAVAREVLVNISTYSSCKVGPSEEQEKRRSISIIS